MGIMGIMRIMGIMVARSVASKFCSAGAGQNSYAQALSNISEILKDDEAYGAYVTYGQTVKNDNTSARRHSKVSELGGCDRAQPSIAEHCSAQRHSKVSELSGLSQTSQASQSSHKRTLAQKFAKMSRKERQRLLKNRQEVGNEK